MPAGQFHQTVDSNLRQMVYFLVPVIHVLDGEQGHWSKVVILGDDVLKLKVMYLDHICHTVDAVVKDTSFVGFSHCKGDFVNLLSIYLLIFLDYPSRRYTR